MLLLLHGTGGDENELLRLGHDLFPSAALLSPRGKVVQDGKSKFLRRTDKGLFDIEDVRSRSLELVGFIESASRTYSLKQEHLVVLGYSSGANMGSALLLLCPRLLAGAVLFRPGITFIPDELPDLSNVAVYMAGGLSDHLVQRDQTEKLFDLLEQCDADVTLNWVNAGHQITRGDFPPARSWLAQHPL